MTPEHKEILRLHAVIRERDREIARLNRQLERAQKSYEYIRRFRENGILFDADPTE